jgi:hypothetical protein
MYLRLVRPQMVGGNPLPSQIPSIPEDYIFDIENSGLPFQPNDIWVLRHRPWNMRLAEYLNFVKLVRVMLMCYDPRNKFFWNAWFALKQRTELLRDAGYALYQSFTELDEDNDSQHAQRQYDYFKFTSEQAHDPLFHPVWRKFILPPASV